MITAEKIKVYDRFDGDEDGLARVGSSNELELFSGNDHWFQIMNFYQDILFINRQLASADYIAKALYSMKQYCDNSAYDILASRIVR